MDDVIDDLIDDLACGEPVWAEATAGARSSAAANTEAPRATAHARGSQSCNRIISPSIGMTANRHRHPVRDRVYASLRLTRTTPPTIHAAVRAKQCRIALRCKALLGPISCAHAPQRPMLRLEQDTDADINQVVQPSRRFRGIRLERERDTVDAVAQPGRPRTILEAMAEMAAAAGAMHLGPRHQQEIIG